MIYNTSITTDNNITEANKQRTVLQLTRGTIHQIDIEFAPGCAGLVHCTINDALHQIWPSNNGESFASDAYVISFKEDYEINIEPLNLDIYTWNLDVLLSHQIIIRIGLLRAKTLLERFF